MSKLIDRILSGEFTLIAEIGVNYYDIAKQEAYRIWKQPSLCAARRKVRGYTL